MGIHGSPYLCMYNSDTYEVTTYHLIDETLSVAYTRNLTSFRKMETISADGRTRGFYDSTALSFIFGVANASGRPVTWGLSHDLLTATSKFADTASQTNKDYDTAHLGKSTYQTFRRVNNQINTSALHFTPGGSTQANGVGNYPLATTAVRGIAVHPSGGPTMRFGHAGITWALPTEASGVATTFNSSATINTLNNTLQFQAGTWNSTGTAFFAMITNNGFSSGGFIYRWNWNGTSFSADTSPRGLNGNQYEVTHMLPDPNNSDAFFVFNKDVNGAYVPGMLYRVVHAIKPFNSAVTLWFQDGIGSYSSLMTKNATMLIDPNNRTALRLEGTNYATRTDVSAAMFPNVPAGNIAAAAITPQDFPVGEAADITGELQGIEAAIVLQKQIATANPLEYLVTEGEGTASAIEGTLPSIQSRIVVQGARPASIEGTLPNLLSEIKIIAGEGMEIEGLLQQISSELNLLVAPEIHISGTLQEIQSELNILAAPKIEFAGTLPGITSDIRIYSEYEANIDAVLPGIESEIIINNAGCRIVGTLPGIESEIIIAEGSGNLGLIDGVLPGIESEIDIGVALPAYIEGTLPNILSELIIKMFKADIEGQLPGIESELTVGQNEFIEIDGQLPALIGEILTKQDTWLEIAGQLPLIEGEILTEQSTWMEIHGTLPLLQSSIVIDVPAAVGIEGTLQPIRSSINMSGTVEMDTFGMLRAFESGVSVKVPRARRARRYRFSVNFRY